MTVGGRIPDCRRQDPSLPEAGSLTDKYDKSSLTVITESLPVGGKFILYTVAEPSTVGIKLTVEFGILTRP
jgi:hypothetical protein